MASTARSNVGTKFYHVACTNSSIATIQLVKILRSKVTWSEQIKSIPVFQHITVVHLSQKHTKKYSSNSHDHMHFTHVSVGD